MQTLILLGVGIAVLLLFSGGSAAGQDTKTLPKDRRYDAIIRKYADLNGLPFAVLKGMIRQESNFDELAWNDERLKDDTSDDAIGLMQIRKLALFDYNRANGRMYAFPDDLYKPEVNIAVGSWYLGSLADRNGLDAAIQMYNVGERGYKNGRRNSQYAANVKAFAAVYA